MMMDDFPSRINRPGDLDFLPFDLYMGLVVIPVSLLGLSVLDLGNGTDRQTDGQTTVTIA